MFHLQQQFMHIHWGAVPSHPRAYGILQQLAIGDVVDMAGEQQVLLEQRIQERLHLSTDGIWRPTATVSASIDMEREFGVKVSGEYKLSGCTDVSSTQLLQVVFGDCLDAKQDVYNICASQGH